VIHGEGDNFLSSARDGAVLTLSLSLLKEGREHGGLFTMAGTTSSPLHVDAAVLTASLLM
jgi:hypothetical protein